MKIVRFLGGLGNQMFQYAFYKSLEQNGAKVKADINGYQSYSRHNGFELEKVFNIQLNNTVSPFTVKLYDPLCRQWHIRKIRRLLGLKNIHYYQQKSPFLFDPSVYNNKPGLLWGYWQNVNYVNPVAETLKRDFIFKNPLHSRNQSLLDDINRNNSVSIHVRRGDYLKDPLLGEICKLDYYQKAVAFMQEHYSDIRFYIFSDDIKWCQANLQISGTTYISGNFPSDSYMDMQLMSHCNHNIIANSSFSWWAAWLNDNKNKKVIAPAKWFNDPEVNTNEVTPSSWLRI